MRRLAVALIALAACAGSCSAMVNDTQAQVPAEGNLVTNAGFEESDREAPRGWTFEARAKNKGKATLSGSHAHSGQFSLELQPNERNKPWDIANHPLSMGQAVPAGPYRGKTLHLSGWLAAEGPAVAVVGLYALRSDGGVAFARIEQDSATPGPVYHEDTLLVPADSKVQYIVVNCAVEGTQGAAFIDDVTVSLSAPPSESLAATPGEGMSSEITIDADREIRRIPRTLYGTNIEWIWNGNGLWNATTKKLDVELVRLSQEAGFSLLRFPGGVFSDFYHWRDGVGPQQSRRTTEHTPGSPKSAHVFGTDEALAFAQATGSELLITVNAGTGTAQEAADWVRYVNSRGGNAPRVNYWEIGNELYIKDPKFVSIDPADYLRRVHEFVRAMRSADPTIKIAAISDENYPRSVTPAYPQWTDQLLRDTSGEIDFISVHTAYAPMLVADKGFDVRTVYAAMLAAPLSIKKNLDAVTAKLDALGRDASHRPKIAVTEWGPFFHFDPQSRFVDHIKTLGSALFVASTLKVFVESPAVEIANAFKLVDPLFMGWIGSRDGGYAPTAPYLAMQLYTRHFGQRVVSATTHSPTYDSSAVGWVDRVTNVPYLDVVASLSGDGKTLYVIAVNKHFDNPISGRIAIRGFQPSGSAVAWVLNGTGIDANTGTRPAQAPGVAWMRQAAAKPNGRFDQGGPGEVTLTSTPVARVSTTFDYSFPPHSVTALELKGGAQ
jgi:alpha-N-arabinofuranosidase